MKIFISWSGLKSHKVACILYDWLPKVIQYTRPYLSSEDIEKGERWLPSLAAELERSEFGITCLTKTNTDAAWLNFEAGALSKGTPSPRLWTFLLGVDVAQVRGPLKQFQHTICKEADILKLLKDINNSASNENRLGEKRLEEAFTQWWPELNQNLQKVLQEPEPRPSPVGHELEAHLWHSKWSYSSDACSDLIKIEQVDKRAGIVRGRRTSKTGRFLYSFDIIGYLLGERMHLTAIHTESPMAVTLVLKRNKFYDKLEGIAIRPAGNTLPDTKKEDTLFYQLDFWAALATYEPVKDPDGQVDPELWSEWKKRDAPDDGYVLRQLKRHADTNQPPAE
jgi:hypothetical protein